MEVLMSSRQQRTWLVLTLILTALCFGAKPVQAQSGLPKRKVMIVGIDGVRPDALAAANTPSNRRLDRKRRLQCDRSSR